VSGVVENGLTLGQHAVSFVDTIEFADDLQNCPNLSGVAEFEVKLHDGNAVFAGASYHADDVHPLGRHRLGDVDEQVHTVESADLDGGHK